MPGWKPEEPAAAYQPRTSWPPLLAVLATLGVVLAAFVASAALTFVVGGVDGAPAALSWRLAGALLTAQIVAVIATWIVAGLRGDEPRDVLALRSAPGGPAVYLRAFAGMVLIFGLFSLVTWLVRPDVIVKDLIPFADLVRSEAWWLALLAIGAGAPLMEELLFRGFLFSALARSFAGPGAAALVTTAAWTALHAYSLVGMVEVFLVGLYLSWLLWRTGSLWVPLFCHAAYNTSVVLFLMAVDIRSLAAA